MMPLRNKQLPDSIMNKMYSSMPYSMIQCEYAQPMRDNVTMKLSLSLAGRIHKMIPAYWGKPDQLIYL